ncbi:hypothetical protein [Rhizobium mongolense]
MTVFDTKKIYIGLAAACILAGSTLASAAADFSYNALLPVYLKLDRTLMPDDIVDGYMETTALKSGRASAMTNSSCKKNEKKLCRS